MDLTNQHLTSDVTPVLARSTDPKITSTSYVSVAGTVSTLAHTTVSTIGSFLTSGLMNTESSASTLTGDFTTAPPLNASVKGTGLAPGVVAGIVVAILVIVGAVIAAVICFLYRKRSGNGQVRVWQENSIHAIPDLTKTRSTWHEDESEFGGGEHSDFNPDLELQPVHIFRDSSVFANSDDDSSVFTDSTQLPSRPHTDKETVVFDSKNKSFKVQNNDKTSIPKSIDNEITENGENTQTESPEHEGTGNMQYAVVQKKSSSFKVVDEVGRNTQFDVAGEESINNEPDEYVVIESKPRATDTESDIGELEETEDDMYTNVEILRVQSVHTSKESKSASIVHEPRRTVSEVRVSAPKRPVPYPRESKKKRQDNYDYPPRRDMSDTQVNTFMSATLPPGYDYVDEASFIANRENRTTEDNADDVYDVPRKRDNGSEIEDEEEIDENDVETTEDVYDVPQRRNLEKDKSDYEIEM